MCCAAVLALLRGYLNKNIRVRITVGNAIKWRLFEMADRKIDRISKTEVTKNQEDCMVITNCSMC